MKTKFYLEGTEITKKEAIAKFGTTRINKYVSSAKKGFKSNPLQEQSWWTGKGTLVIDFE